MSLDKLNEPVRQTRSPNRSSPFKVYDSWVTEPLSPRKLSPGKRRIAAGHKATQSLSLPRGSDFGQLPSPERQRDLVIVSPRPQRAMPRVPEDMAKTVDSEEAHEPMPPIIPQRSPDHKVQSKRAIETPFQAPSPLSSPLRGPRSSARPPEHRRMYSQPQASFKEAYMQKLSGALLKPADEVEDLQRTIQSLDINEKPIPKRFEQHHGDSLGTPFVARETHASTRGNLPMSEVEMARSLLDARMYVLTCGRPEAELDWARDVLRLTDQQETRHRRNSEQSPALSPAIYEQQHEAINVVDRAITSYRSPRAEFMKGLWHEFGKHGYAVDKREASRYYGRAARGGYVRAEYRLGIQHENLGDMVKACSCYERGAQRNDSACLYRLGMIILLGQYGYDRDAARGLRHIHLSAKLADIDAPQGAYVYGLLLSTETTFEVPDGILTVDIDEARLMFERAAALGFAAAQSRLGKAYEFAELDYDFDPRLSMHYYHLAALNDDAEADMALSKWYLCGYEDVIEKDETKAFEFAQRAAKRGVATAEFAMGYFYEVGVHVTADIGEAQLWYAKAAEHGNEDARGRIDGIKRTGTLSRKDHEFNVSTRIQARHATIKSKASPRLRRNNGGSGNLPESPMGKSPLLAQHSFQSFARRGSMVEQDEAPQMMEPRKARRQSPSQPPPAPPLGYLRMQTLDTSLDNAMAPPLSARLLQRDRSPETRPGHRHMQSWSPGIGNVDGNVNSIGSNRHGRGLLPVTLRDEQDNKGDGRRDSYDGDVWAGSQCSVNAPPVQPLSVADFHVSLHTPRPESSISNVHPSNVHDHNHSAMLNTMAPTIPLPPKANSASGSHGVPGSSVLSDSRPNRSHSSVPASTSTSTSRAPTTFEEMGIPTKRQKESECSIM